jgi:hypothetical protein
MYWTKKILSLFQKLTNSKKVKIPLKFNEFIKNFYLKFEGNKDFNINFTFSSHEYRMENKYQNYYFYLYFDENKIRIDIIGEKGEEFLTLIYRFESKNVDFVEIETIEIEKQKYLNGIDFYDKNGEKIYSIISANKDLAPGWLGTLYCTEKFQFEKAFFRKKDNEIIEINSYNELIKENKIHHDMTTRDFYLQHLESILKK